MGDQIVRVLWADDDSRDALAVLATVLAMHGWTVDCVCSYTDGRAHLRNARESKLRYDALMIDAILPHTEPGSLGDFVGLTLARRACEDADVEKVIFLTVVPRSMIGRDIEQLVADFPAIAFEYVHKLTLDSERSFKRLAESVRGHGSVK